MSGRWRAALVSGSGVSLAVVGSAASAHRAAGGHLAVPATLLAFAVTAALAATAVRLALRWTFPRLVAVAVTAQPLLHAVLGAGGSGHGHAPAHAGHSSGAAAASHADPRMLIAHLAVTFATAVLLRWGLRWLQRLPALARALLLPRHVAAPRVATVRFAPPAGDVARELAVLGVRADRGPPR